MKTTLIKIIMFGFAGLILMLVACSKDVSSNQPNPTPNPTGKTAAVNIFLTDDQSLLFDEVNIDILSMEIKVEDSSEMEYEHDHQGQSDDDDQNGHTSGGWMSVDIQPGVYNVLKFRNGLDTLFASASFATNRSVRKIRLTLGSNNSAVLNGVTTPVVVKDKDNVIVIKLHELEISSETNSVTNFWLDFDAGRSIREHGNELELKPQVKAFRKEKSGSIEGRILPADANAIVYAINGTDTTSARPEIEGEFKIIGLKGGTYSIVIDATANNYIDQTISGIKVEQNDDAKLGTVTLIK